MSKGLRYKEKELLPSRYERSSHKHAFSQDEHRAFRVVAQPFMLTLTGRKRLTTTEWLDLVTEALKTGCNTGLELKIDGFRQPRDRSIHLAIWGLPVGLMLSGPMIEHLGFQFTMTSYALVGMALTLAIGLRWRQALWHEDPPG